MSPYRPTVTTNLPPTRHNSVHKALCQQWLSIVLVFSLVQSGPWGGIGSILRRDVTTRPMALVNGIVVGTE